MIDDETNREDAGAEEAAQPEEQAPEAGQPEQEPQGEAQDGPQAEQEPTAEGEDETADEEAVAEEPEGEAGAEDEEDEDEEKKDEPPGASLEPLLVEERELSAEERARLEAEAEERARREAAATAEDDGEEDEPARAGKIDLPADTNVQATGKRKSAVARVIVRRGNGSFWINGRDLPEYFPRPLHQTVIKQPLLVTGYDGHVDIRVRVHGGGLTGQADAVRHGIARALCEIDPQLRPELKRRGMLTRDARVKERRKAGLKKARKRPQFSKR
jgi:small subunit ribosomal protein S9